ncbi:50S ribosomal protein L4 [Candidatus Pacearchaeota archaeon ex4484_71]|nr:MAG: 50S ribosomal protein L4 [Candidatus Pacearchaeota archaeon ex4484_71]
MKTKIYTVDGKKGKDLTLSKDFSTPVREDIVLKIIESKKTEQPYSPSPVAGNQYSASGKLVHRRHVWKSQYGRGMSRIPRKKMSRRGTQFNWVGATVPNTRGGRRAHPPRVESRISTIRINKKEMKIGFWSAISATINEKYLKRRYSSLEGKKIENPPFIVESKILDLKTRKMKESIEKIIGKELFSIALQTKRIRKGIGKMRGRKYKKSAGLLFVVGNDEKLKTKLFDVKKVNQLSILDLTKGALGRLTVYTENAIKDIETHFRGGNKK